MYPFRKELVGKRFLCVRDSKSNSNRPNSRSNRPSNPLDYQWKCGIIRACTEQDSSHPDQKVLVEYDNEEWTTREWLQVYSDVWKVFLVEKDIVWAQRFDPNYPKRSLLWPALTFYPLVDKHGLEENQSIGVEFLGDHVRAFCKSNEMRPYQEDDGLQPALRNNSKVVEELINWQTLQKSQGILIHGPFTLTGFRVQVYREKCRQWYSAVITSHDLISREMDVMDDTVLQTHRINPRLVMVILLANEVELDSMLRGDLVRVLPVRRNRQSQVVITSSYTSTTPSSTPGNSMWQFLNNMLRDPPSTPPVQTSTYQRAAFHSPPGTLSTATNSTAFDDERRTSEATRNSERQASRESMPTTEKEVAAASLQEHENSTKSLGLQKSSTSLVKAPLPLRSPITSPVHYKSPYSSLENLSNSSSSPRNMSPQRPFGSPQKSSPLSSSSAVLRSSPFDSSRSPPKILEHPQAHFSSPHHPMNQTPPKRQFTPPSSSSRFSPLRSNKLSPILSSPSVHSVSSSSSFSSLKPNRISPVFSSPHLSLQNSGLSPSCLNPAGHSHDSHQTMGPFSRQSSQDVSTNQLYALQLQQQRQLQNQQLQQFQHEQILSQFYMQMNQLQQMADQLKSCQQGTLSHEQREMLSFYYSQIMSQYQQASLLKYHSAMVSQDSTMLSAEQQEQLLREQMQLKYISDQQFQQDNYKWLYAGPENDQFQSMLSHMQQYSNVEHLQKLYAEFTHEKSKDSVQEKEDDMIKDHVARLKKFIPSKQGQMKTNSQAAVTSSPSLSTKPTKDTISIPNTSSSSFACLQSLASSKESTTSTAAVVSILPLMQNVEKDDNKTDDQKVVDALVRKPSVSESPSTSAVETNKSSFTLMATGQENKTSSPAPPLATCDYKLQEQFSKQETKKTEVSPKKDDDPFGFNGIGDDVSKEASPAALSLDKLSEDGNNLSTFSCSKNKNKGKKTALSTLVDHSVEHFHDKPSSEAEAIKSEAISSRESVIKYVVNKSEPLVSSLNIPKEEASPLDTETLPFSVDQLLEFHKTSAQAAVKVFEEANETAEQSSPNANQKQGKKRKKEGRIEDRDNKEIPARKSTKGVKKSKKSKHQVDGSKQELIGCLENKPRLQTLDLQGKGDKDEFKKQKTGNKKAGAKSFHEPSYTLCQKTKETDIECIDGLRDQKTSRTSVPEIMSTDLQDQRTSNQLSSTDSIVSNSNSTTTATVPVNFVADKSVISVTVSRATEPVLASSLTCETEYVVEQIEIFSEPVTDDASSTLKSEQTRKRKKSRKVLENELLLEQELKEEEKEKLKKKLKKCKTADKKETGDNADEEKQERSENESKKKKKKKSHKTKKEGLSDDSEGKEKMSKDTKKKKSKKLEKPEDFHLQKTETPTADSKQMGTDANEGDIPNTMENAVVQSSLQEMDGQRDLEVQPVVGKHTEAPVEVKNQESASIEPERTESNKSVSLKKSQKKKNDKVMEGNVKSLTDTNKEKMKKDKKTKPSKMKEATSKEVKDTITAEKEPEVKKDDSCNGNDQRVEPDAIAAAEKKDKSHQNDKVEEETAGRKKEDTGIATNNQTSNDETNNSEHSVKVETEMSDQEKKSEDPEVKKKTTGKKKITEKTKSVKRKQDTTSEELSVHKKKQKVKEPAEEFFLQNSGCLAFSKLPRCRDCRDEEEKPSESIYSQQCCRFTLFRRLKKKKRSDKVQVAGFLSPDNAEPDDFQPWLAHQQVVNILSKNEALYILKNVADEFCSLVQEEKGARALVPDGSFVAYKRAVTGLREMCDACATTIFNIHWVCQKCGFGVCLDCYELRIKEKTMLKCSENKSIIDGVFPKLWKSAKVSALFKGGDKLSKDNYRPISILPTVSKIIEKAVHLQLSTYLEQNKLISTSQFGFRLGKSTTTALVNFTDHILSSMDDGKVTGAVFLDLKKAFDTVNHELLVKKLKSLGVAGKSLSWFNSYLCSRTQRTMCGNIISPEAKVSIGVPQGSILGPLLFLIYINGIESTLEHSKMTMFADDMAFYCPESSSINLQHKLNSDLQSVSAWLQEHKLTLNVKKSKFMIIGNGVKLKNFQDVRLLVEQDSLENVTEFKYLGVVINQHLTWHDHIDMLSSKVSQRLGILKRIKHLLPLYARKLYVMTMIVPLFDYASIIWGDKNNKVLMTSLQVLHSKAAKLVLNQPPWSSSTEALEKLKWLDLSQRREFHRCVYTYTKVSENSSFFTKGTDIHKYNTRNKDLPRIVKSNRNWGLQRSQNSCVQSWNSLPNDIKLLSTKIKFKRALKCYFQSSI